MVDAVKRTQGHSTGDAIKIEQSVMTNILRIRDLDIRQDSMIATDNNSIMQVTYMHIGRQNRRLLPFCLNMLASISAVIEIMSEILI